MVVVTVEDRLWLDKLVVLVAVQAMERRLGLAILLQHLQARVLLVVLVARLVEVHLTLTVLVVGEAVVRQVLLVQLDQMFQEVAMVVTERHQVFQEHQ